MLHWRHIALISCLLAGAAAGALGLSLWLSKPPDRSPPPFPSRIATDTEQRAIVAILLGGDRFEGVPPPPPEPGKRFEPKPPGPLLVAVEAMQFCPDERPSASLAQDCGKTILLPSDSIRSKTFDLDFAPSPELPADFRSALVAANLKAQRLPLPQVERAIATSETELRQSLGSGRWDDFYARYPDTAGVLRLTRAVVSKDGGSALIYAEHRCDGLCGSGKLFRLIHADGQWRVQNAFMLWIS